MTNMTLCPKIKFGRERIMIAMEMSFFILRCPLVDPGKHHKMLTMMNVQKKEGTKMTSMTGS